MLSKWRRWICWEDKSWQCSITRPQHDLHCKLNQALREWNLAFSVAVLCFQRSLPADLWHHFAFSWWFRNGFLHRPLGMLHYRWATWLCSCQTLDQPHCSGAFAFSLTSAHTSSIRTLWTLSVVAMRAWSVTVHLMCRMWTYGCSIDVTFLFWHSTYGTYYSILVDVVLYYTILYNIFKKTCFCFVNLLFTLPTFYQLASW